jgi:hypothetical protein
LVDFFVPSVGSERGEGEGADAPRDEEPLFDFESFSLGSSGGLGSSPSSRAGSMRLEEGWATDEDA